jgi:hypothetical protein
MEAVQLTPGGDRGGRAVGDPAGAAGAGAVPRRHRQDRSLRVLGTVPRDALRRRPQAAVHARHPLQRPRQGRNRPRRHHRPPRRFLVQRHPGSKVWVLVRGDS